MLSDDDWTGATPGLGPVRTSAEAVVAARRALRLVGSPHAENSFRAHWEDGDFWLVLPTPDAVRDTDVSAAVHPETGAVTIGFYLVATINDKL